MAEARYIDGHILHQSLIPDEVQYHLNNLVLLSMYFDIVFIQTAAIFNVNDLFLREVIQRTLSHPKFREMLSLGCIRICGWGGASPREMYSNAFEYASMGTANPFSGQYARELQRVFLPTNLTFRVQDHPEDEANHFRRALRETALIDRAVDMDRVERAIDQSERRVGALAAVAFLPALATQKLPRDSRRLVYSTFINAWAGFLNQDVPGIHTYVAATDPAAIRQMIDIDGKPLRAFLFNPRIFSAFLQRYFSSIELNRILSRPYRDVHDLRNGDWKRFCDAYHAAVEMVSDSVSELDHPMLDTLGIRDQVAWGSKIWEDANKKNPNFDVNAFIQSLASISGTFLSIPILGPIINVAGVLLGRRMNAFSNRLLKEHGSGTSPYIRKLRMNLALQLSTA